MGYSTGFTLNVHEGEMEIREILEQEEDFEGLDYAIDIDGNRIDDVYWYNHEKDMKELSLKYPDIVFILHGEGEDVGDIWYKYFKNGKMQSCYAELTFDTYDESQLK